MDLTEQPVDWAYEVWDQLLVDVREGDNHLRSIAAQVLCNLAKSDPADRMAGTFDALIKGTRDARHDRPAHAAGAVAYRLSRPKTAATPTQRLCHALYGQRHGKELQPDPLRYSGSVARAV